VGEHVTTLEVGVLAQGGAQAGAVEDVVAQDQRHGVLADEVGADDEGLRETVRAGLGGIGQGDAPGRAVAEKALELLEVLGCRDDQDLADPGHQQGRERVVDHRLVIDRHELLADAAGDGVKP